MTDIEMSLLLETSDRLVAEQRIDFRRYLNEKIDWSEDLICIKGPKGTGKTTLILQHIKENFGIASNKAAYFSLDHIWFADHQPIEAVD